MPGLVRSGAGVRPAVVSTALALLSVLSLVLAPAASAGGYITSDTYFCSEGQVSIKPPRTWTTNARPEQVYWAPVLYQWQNGTHWVPIAHHNFAIATVNNQGYAVVGWTDVVDYYGVRTRGFTINQPGTYAVANYLVWAGDASTQLSWASPPDSRGYCVFTSRMATQGRDVVSEPEDAGEEPVGFGQRLLQPARQVISVYLDALVGEPPAPSSGQVPTDPTVSP